MVVARVVACVVALASMGGVVMGAQLRPRLAPPRPNAQTADTDPTPPMAWDGWPREAARLLGFLTPAPRTWPQLHEWSAGKMTKTRLLNAVAWLDIAGLVVAGKDAAGAVVWAVRHGSAVSEEHAGRVPGWGSERGASLAAALAR